MTRQALRLVGMLGVFGVFAIGNAPFAMANYIVNGDFESTTGWTSPPNDYPTTSTPPLGWEYRFVLPSDSYSEGLGCAVQESMTPLEGLTSAKIGSFGDGNGDDGGDHDWQALYQSVGTAADPVSSQWQFDVDVDCTASGSARAFQCFLLYGDGGSGATPSSGLSSINLRVTSDGGLDVYHSIDPDRGWHDVFAAGTIDVDTLQHISVVGDFDTTDGTATPSYTIAYTDDDGMQWSDAFSRWYGAAPTSSQSLVAIQFGSNQQADAEYGAYTSPYVIDQVSVVPEPATWSMLLAGFLALLGLRRLRR